MVIRMNIFNVIKERIKTNSIFYFVYTPCVTFIILMGFLLLCYPEAATEGVKKGISVCINTLIPTLFPFMLLSQFAVGIKMFNTNSKILSRIFYMLFRLPPSTLPIIVFSFIGGFPLGALLIKSAYEKGEISLSQGQRMLLFCVIPGPSFAVTTVGYALYGSEKIGMIVYASSVLASLIIGFLSRFLCEDEEVCESKQFTTMKVRYSTALGESVNLSVKGIVNICVWVVVFSCVGELVRMFVISPKMSDFILMISEVTNGVYRAAYSYSLPIVCAVIGFSGFCLHIQVIPSIIRLKLRYRYFLVARIIAAAFNCIICYLLMDFFKSDVAAVAVGVRAETVSVASSVPMCMCLMIFCGLFVAGEDFYKAYSEKNKEGYRTNKTELY